MPSRAAIALPVYNTDKGLDGLLFRDKSFDNTKNVDNLVKMMYNKDRILTHGDSK